jgi:hypothetical protein
MCCRLSTCGHPTDHRAGCRLAVAKPSLPGCVTSWDDPLHHLPAPPKQSQHYHLLTSPITYAKSRRHAGSTVATCRKSHHPQTACKGQDCMNPSICSSTGQVLHSCALVADSCTRLQQPHQANITTLHHRGGKISIVTTPCEQSCRGPTGRVSVGRSVCCTTISQPSTNQITSSQRIQSANQSLQSTKAFAYQAAHQHMTSAHHPTSM